MNCSYILHPDNGFHVKKAQLLKWYLLFPNCASSLTVAPGKYQGCLYSVETLESQVNQIGPIILHQRNDIIHNSLRSPPGWQRSRFPRRERRARSGRAWGRAGAPVGSGWRWRGRTPRSTPSSPRRRAACQCTQKYTDARRLRDTSG